MASEPSFDVVTTADVRPGKQLLFGVSHLGMAGVTATDYLVRHLDSELFGHVTSSGFPAIAPFEAGEPRHPMRLYTTAETDLAVFVGESFVPVWAAEAFVDGFLEWIDDSPVEEIVLLYGVPFPHGAEQHRVFYTATPTYRERHLQDSDLEPLAGGFLDGIVAEFVLRSFDGEAPPIGVFITPTHPPGPDLDAALLLLEAVQGVWDLTVDEQELMELAEQMKQYYGELADRMQALNQGEQPLSSRDYPEDRMFM